MAWDKKKYFRERQATLRFKAKEYDKLMTINPNFGKEIAAERIGELEKAARKALKLLQMASSKDEIDSAIFILEKLLAN